MIRFESFRTNIGYCHIGNENLVLSLDNDIEKVSEILLFKHNGIIFLKLVFAIGLFFFSYDNFNNHKITEGI